MINKVDTTNNASTLMDSPSLNPELERQDSSLDTKPVHHSLGKDKENDFYEAIINYLKRIFTATGDKIDYQGKELNIDPLCKLLELMIEHADLGLELLSKISESNHEGHKVSEAELVKAITQLRGVDAPDLKYKIEKAAGVKENTTSMEVWGPYMEAVEVLLKVASDANFNQHLYTHASLMSGGSIREGIWMEPDDGEGRIKARSPRENTPEQLKVFDEQQAKKDKKYVYRRAAEAEKFLQHPWINNFLAIGDLLSSCTDFKLPRKMLDMAGKSLGDKWKWAIDYYSVWLTKLVMMSRYIAAGINAFKNNRIIESFGRVIGILALPFVHLEDITLATGLGTFFSQSDLGLEASMGKEKKFTDKWVNIKEWVGTWLDMTKEVFTKQGLWGATRKIFPDFKFSQFGEILRRIPMDLMNKPVKVEEGEKEEGHTTLFGAYFIGFGALFGILFGRKARNIFNKIGGVIRNFGGILGDYSLLTHPDRNMRMAGIFAGTASIIDAIQRFMPDWLINRVNHFNLINNLFVTMYYSQRTTKKTDEDIVSYDDVLEHKLDDQGHKIKETDVERDSGVNKIHETDAEREARLVKLAQQTQLAA